VAHAVTRIISFLILAFFLALGDTSVIIFCCILTAVIYSCDPPEDFSKLFQTIKRMKWFFLSILLVYLFINTSNISLFLQFQEGLKRILILIILILLVSWIINKTPRDQIISALIFLLSPLKIIGFPTHKLALRIELIFRNFDEIQRFVVSQKNKVTCDIKNISEIGKALSSVYIDIVDMIETKPLDEIVVSLKSSISPLQWLFPVFLFIILFLIHNLL